MPKARTNGAAKGSGRGSMKGTLKRLSPDGKVVQALEVDLAGPIPKVGPEYVPTRVVDELREACRIAADYAGAFGDACKAQAEKYKIAPGALKRYIKALEGDKLEETEHEADDLKTLIDRHGQRA